MVLGIKQMYLKSNSDYFKDKFMEQVCGPYEIPQSIKDYAEEVAPLLMAERHHKTLDGGMDFSYRGVIVQEMFHWWLDAVHNKYPHEYLKPYHKTGKPKDAKGNLIPWDLKIADETFDTKCRGFWWEESPQNMELKFTQTEYDDREENRVDYYLIGVTDGGEGKYDRQNVNNVYLLGGLGYNEFWNKMKPKREFKANGEKREYKIPTYGYISARDLDDFKKVVFRV